MSENYNVTSQAQQIQNELEKVTIKDALSLKAAQGDDLPSYNLVEASQLSCKEGHNAFHLVRWATHFNRKNFYFSLGKLNLRIPEVD